MYLLSVTKFLPEQTLVLEGHVIAGIVPVSACACACVCVCVFALGYDDRDDVDDVDEDYYDDDDGDGDGDGDDHFLRLARFHVGRPILKF